MAGNQQLFQRRRNRVRRKIKRHSSAPRLSVHRTNKHIYAQIIDDESHTTVAYASSSDKSLGDIKKPWDVEAAKKVGTLIAEKAIKAKISEVVFDRGGYIFHGRVKALADAAREAGLKF